MIQKETHSDYSKGHNKQKSTQRRACFLIVALTFSLLALSACNQAETTESTPLETTMPVVSSTLTPNPTLTPTPSPSPTPIPTPTPTPTPPPVQAQVSIAQDLPCYAEPRTDAPIVGWLKFREPVNRVTAFEDDQFAQILLADDAFAYCDKTALSGPNARVYAETIEGYFPSALSDATPDRHYVKLVDIRRFAPQLQIYQVFATPDNFTGVQLYERNLCLIQEATLKKLLKAQEIFARDGYTIKIYDAYRPYRTTVYLSVFNQNSYYLARPETGSTHNRGAAIDMTLVDVNGIELEMPSLIHTLDQTSGIEYEGMSEAARRNLDYMRAVMLSCGFTGNRYEWWHYNDSNRLRYPILDIDLGSIRVMSTNEKPAASPPPITNPKSAGYSPLGPTPSPSPTPTPEPSPTPALEETTAETTAETTVEVAETTDAESAETAAETTVETTVETTAVVSGGD